MLWRNACLIVLIAVFTLACTRYDYHSRGVHQNSSGKPAASSYKKPIKGTYIVRQGDTLYSIGKRFGVNYRQLAKKNHIGSGYTIFVGQRLYLKGIAPVVSATHYTKKPRVPPSVKKPASIRPIAKHPVASSSKVKLIWPVKGKVTSRFGPRNNRMHDGIDVGANEGVSIHAAAAGEVVYADARLTGYGNLIILRHSSDMFTAYAHNKVNLVKLGEKVKSGQRIAYVGSTGRASGPHLHFEVRRGETAVDPLAYLPKR